MKTFFVDRDELAIRGGNDGSRAWSGRNNAHFPNNVSVLKHIDDPVIDDDLGFSSRQDKHLMPFIALRKKRLPSFNADDVRVIGKKFEKNHDGRFKKWVTIDSMSSRFLSCSEMLQNDDCVALRCML